MNDFKLNWNEAYLILSKGGRVQNVLFNSSDYWEMDKSDNTIYYHTGNQNLNLVLDIDNLFYTFMGKWKEIKPDATYEYYPVKNEVVRITDYSKEYYQLVKVVTRDE